MAKRVADLLTEVLADAGVRRIYGVSGGSLNGITDSMRQRGDIQWVHVRHEETAAFAAGADALVSGMLGSMRRELRSRKSALDQRPL
jgi:pyruvate dehydrogenase (quinone)